MRGAAVPGCAHQPVDKNLNHNIRENRVIE